MSIKRDLIDESTCVAAPMATGGEDSDLRTGEKGFPQLKINPVEAASGDAWFRSDTSTSPDFLSDQ